MTGKASMQIILLMKEILQYYVINKLFHPKDPPSNSKK